MASAPPRPSSSPRQAIPEEAEFNSLQPESSIEQTEQEETSQSYVLNNPKPTESTKNEKQGVAQPPEEGPRTCWICQMDDTDDGPDTSPWRSPCPCSLQAHEACLMDWISVAGEKDLAPKIVCPVCKYQLQIDVPKDYLVMTVDRLHRYAKKLVLPTAATAVLGITYTGLFVYGANSLSVVFGADEAERMMAGDGHDYFSGLVTKFFYPPGRSSMGSILDVFGDSLRPAIFDQFTPVFRPLPNLKTLIGVPLILPALLLSRSTIADPAFTILPVTYFLFNPDNKYIANWPPSPANAFALLPYVRLAYNSLYKAAFADAVKKWDLAIQRKPREGETAEQIAQERANDDGNGFFDIQVDIGVEEEEQEQNRNAAAAPPAARPHNNNVPAAAPAQNNNRQRDGWELHHNVDTSALAFKIMGAIWFPVISGVMGDVLRLTLPKALLRHGRGKGLLSQKWGRSMVGGCLFVVLKDVVVLYCKWKKARDCGKKRVRDFVRG